MNIKNYIKINRQISTAGQPTRAQFQQIADAGFDVVINLAMHNKGALKKEDKIVSKCGMLYIHIPITWKSPEVDRLQLFLKILDTLIKEKKRVFVHCILNYRASVFVYQYKKSVLKEEDVRLIAPKKFKPKPVWQEMIEIEMDIV